MAAETDAYGVNLFAPHPVPVDPPAYAAYREALRPLAARFGVDLPEHPVEDDDHWHDKIDVLVAAAPRVVSFTFGLPDPASVAALHRAGSLLAQTVTTATRRGRRPRPAWTRSSYRRRRPAATRGPSPPSGHWSTGPCRTWWPRSAP